MVLAGAPVAAVAQPVPEQGVPGTGPVLRLTRLTGVTGPGSVPVDSPLAPPTDIEVRVAVDHRGSEPIDNLRVVVEAHRPASSRSQLHSQLDQGNTGAPRLIETTDLRDGEVLEPGSIAGAVLTLPVARVTAAGGGVYPIEISLVRGTEVLDRLVTAVVHLAEPPVAPLQTVVVWPLDAPVWRTTGGHYPAGVDDEILPGRRLERLLTAVERVPDAPVVLAPAAHLVEALVDRADGFTEAPPSGGDRVEAREVPADQAVARRSARFLERIREVLGRLPHAPITGPYADADIAGLAGGPPALALDAGIAASEGRRRLLALTGSQADPATSLATAPLTPDALDVVPGDHVLLSYRQIVGPDPANHPDLPTPVRTLEAASGRRLTATVADPYLADLLQDAGAATHGPLAVVQRMLAETAMIHFERPGEEGRPLLLLPPADWAAHPRVPGALLPALVAAPWLQLVDPATQLAAAGGSGPRATLALQEAALPAQLATSLTAVKADLAALVDALPDPEAPVGGRRVARLTDQLLRATSTWLVDRDPIEALQLVRDVQDAVDQAFGDVEVPTTAEVTLTSERGTIPVTLRRPTGGPLEVRVQVEAPGALSWEGEHGAVQTFQLGGAGATQTVSFEAFARSRGIIPVTVTVTDPTGRRVLAEERLTVRSTAISGPALLILGVIVVGLLVVGEWRRRRPRRPELSVVGERAATAPPTTRTKGRRRYARRNPGGG